MMEEALALSCSSSSCGSITTKAGSIPSKFVSTLHHHRLLLPNTTTPFSSAAINLRLLLSSFDSSSFSYEIHTMLMKVRAARP